MFINDVEVWGATARPAPLPDLRLSRPCRGPHGRRPMAGQADRHEEVPHEGCGRERPVPQDPALEEEGASDPTAPPPPSRRPDGLSARPSARPARSRRVTAPPLRAGSPVRFPSRAVSPWPLSPSLIRPCRAGSGPPECLPSLPSSRSPRTGGTAPRQGRRPRSRGPKGPPLRLLLLRRGRKLDEALHR